MGETVTRTFPWTFLPFPLLLLAPGQLSLTAGVAGADCWLVIGSSAPLPLLDACRCVATGRHMGSATFSVSVFIISIVVAGAVAALGQVEGGAIGAKD